MMTALMILLPKKEKYLTLTVMILRMITNQVGSANNVFIIMEITKQLTVPDKNEGSDDDEDVSSGVDSNTEEVKTESEIEEPEDSPIKGRKRKRPQSTRSNKKLITPKMTPTSNSRPSFSTGSAKAKLSLFKNVSVPSRE